jgi:hypothetical protein
VANRALLLALESTDPPRDHHGIYPRDALLAANYSVPVLWLSLFDADGLVTWPGIHGGSPFAAVIGPASECVERSRTRLQDWSSRWPQVFADMSETWLSYIAAVDDSYLAIWTEELSDMTGDEKWAAELRGYLRGLDDPGSAGFRDALVQSYLYPSRKGLEPFDKVGSVTAGYTWARQAPWEGAGHGPFFNDMDHPGCRICAQ